VVKRVVRIYIEGGAVGRGADSDFRRGWKTFLKELHDTARAQDYHSLEIVRGGSRAEAFRRFKRHKTEHPNDLCVLLVDSETAVPEGARVWDSVARREGDDWQRPSWATERHLYLMVQFVETWLTSDPEALRAFFKRGFKPERLPTSDLEGRSKGDIEEALKSATQDSRKGPYRHGQAHEIIELVRPDRVKALKHGQRLFSSLGSPIKGEREPKIIP
jgi:hypothetical protein